MNHCAAAEMLGVYALHACPTDELVELESHLVVCPMCVAELATLTNVVDRIDELMLMEPTPDEGRQGYTV